MNIFKVAVLGIFALFIVLAVLIFSGVLGGDNGTGGVGGSVVIWGSVPSSDLEEAFSAFRIDHSDEFEARYVEKRAETFDRDLVEALASGTGPDIILLPDNLIVRHSDKLFPVPYESFSLRKFKDTFIEEGELYIVPNGILALPLFVDPLVMYWNRDIFTAEGIAKPPSYWDEFFTLAPKLTRKQENLTITRSTVALGEYQNITHAKDVLTLLMLQAGEPLTQREGNTVTSVLGDKHGFIDAPAISALRFYTEFSNSTKDFYSWNRALSNDKSYFSRGNLAVYFGFASEEPEIRASNPNLNFDVARVPQVRDVERLTTVGKMTGVAILKTSQNLSTAFYVSFLLTDPSFVETVLTKEVYTSARRDMLSQKGNSATAEIKNTSALFARSWLDPEPEETELLFKEMIESVVSGRNRLSEAISRASDKLDTLLR